MENKFKVIEMFPEIKGAQLMSDWLNERYALGEELVATYKDKFIFKISNPKDISGSSININIKGSSDLNTEEVIKIINDALSKRGIKRETIK